MRCFLAILFFAATVSAGTVWPAVVEVREDDYDDQGPLYFPSTSLTQQEADALDSTTAQEARPWQEEGDSDLDDPRPSDLIRGIQEQLMEDLLRMEQDLLLIRRLMGQGSPHSGPHRPPVVFSPFPWRPPMLPPGRRDPWTNDEGETDEGGDSPWFRIPGLGFDRPVFPDLPQLPSVPRVDQLPDNYDNSTHQVHEVNGSRVEVNTTTNKQSGDGFNTFFHHQVIHISPGEDRNGEEPGNVDYSTTTPQEEEEEQGEEEVEEEEEEVSNFIPRIPEVDNEVEARGLPETPTAEEVLPEVSRGGYAGRALFASPSSATYLVNRLYNDDEGDDDDDKINGDYEDIPKPKLLGDTRVNHVMNGEQQGITMVDPEAEIFDLGLVNKEARRSEEE